MIEVTIDRTSLELPPLVLGSDPFVAPLYLPEDAVTWPEWSIRRTYAPESAWLAGTALLAAVREASTLPLVVYARGETTAALEAAKRTLEAATSQWDYDITLTVDGVATSWRADPELPTWGLVDAGMVRAGLARGAVTVPINPSGA